MKIPTEEQRMADLTQRGDEIVEADKQNYHILLGMLTAIFGGFALAFSIRERTPSLCLVLVLQSIVFTAHRLICGNRLRIWRLSTYIKVFIDPFLPATQYQTRLSQQRVLSGAKESTRRLFSSDVITNEWLITLFLNLACVFIAISTMASRDALFSVSDWILCCASLVVAVPSIWYASVQANRLKRGGIAELDLEANWRKVKHEEDAAGGAPRVIS